VVREVLPQVPGFRILRRLGAGARGTVYEAIQDETERAVALKLFEPMDEPDAALPEEVEHERRVAASLRHRNLVRIHAMGEHGQRRWLASEYLPGGSLAERMGKALAPARALEILRDLARGLGHAHARGVIHGDVKPGNVLFRGMQGSGEAVLVDFGAAVWLHNGAARAAGGTPGYMSPEQARGEPIDARSDFYSLGVVLYEMLTRHLLPHAPSQAALARGMADLPAPVQWLRPLFDALLAQDPSDRPADARALLALLESLQAASPEATEVLPGTADWDLHQRIHGVAMPRPLWHRRGALLLLSAAVLAALALALWSGSS